MRTGVVLACLVPCVGLLSCAPDRGLPASVVTGLQILAVRGEPPEVGAGQSARFDLLVASPGGTVAATVGWSMCLTPGAPGDNDVASAACVAGQDGPAAEQGPSVIATVPGDACARFGPDPPPGGLRPPSPDATGGYYQPVRADVPGAGVAVGLERLTCDLAGAPASVAHQYATQYALNRNPALAALTATAGASPVALTSIPAGQRLTLEAAWSASSAETYVAFDPSTQTIVPQREAMQVSWHASDGTFDADRTGRGSGDLATTTSNGWTAPGRAGTVHVWVVLRDSRGGVDFASYDLTIVP